MLAWRFNSVATHLIRNSCLRYLHRHIALLKECRIHSGSRSINISLLRSENLTEESTTTYPSFSFLRDHDALERPPLMDMSYVSAASNRL